MRSSEPIVANEYLDVSMKADHETEANPEGGNLSKSPASESDLNDQVGYYHTDNARDESSQSNEFQVTEEQSDEQAARHAERDWQA